MRDGVGRRGLGAGRLGRCGASFWLALAFDAAGLSLLLSGVFSDAAFADLLVYCGGLGIFLSLLWWVFWYAGNIEVPPAQLQDDVGLGRPKRRPPAAAAPGPAASGLSMGARLRSLSRRFSEVFYRPRCVSVEVAQAVVEMEPL